MMVNRLTFRVSEDPSTPLGTCVIMGYAKQDLGTVANVDAARHWCRDREAELAKDDPAERKRRAFAKMYGGGPAFGRR